MEVNVVLNAIIDDIKSFGFEKVSNINIDFSDGCPFVKAQGLKNGANIQYAKLLKN